ncbi:MAG: hypothetical protein FRX49_09546 [Trebouxia sp. A1-2]|nr:MAG: hypothetical protein FRX49_09546 [Trebouxia sp. A1-2]
MSAGGGGLRATRGNLRVCRSLEVKGLYRSSSSGSGVKVSTAKLLKRVPAVPMSEVSANMQSQSLNGALTHQNNSMLGG